MERNFTTRNNTMKDVSLMEKSDIRTAMSKNQHHPSQKQYFQSPPSTPAIPPIIQALNNRLHHIHNILGNIHSSYVPSSSSGVNLSPREEFFPGGMDTTNPIKLLDMKEVDNQINIPISTNQHPLPQQSPNRNKDNTHEDRTDNNNNNYPSIILAKDIMHTLKKKTGGRFYAINDVQENKYHLDNDDRDDGGKEKELIRDNDGKGEEKGDNGDDGLFQFRLTPEKGNKGGLGSGQSLRLKVLERLKEAGMGGKGKMLGNDGGEYKQYNSKNKPVQGDIHRSCPHFPMASKPPRYNNSIIKNSKENSIKKSNKNSAKNSTNNSRKNSVKRTSKSPKTPKPDPIPQPETTPPLPPSKLDYFLKNKVSTSFAALKSKKRSKYLQKISTNQHSQYTGPPLPSINRMHRSRTSDSEYSRPAHSLGINPVYSIQSILPPVDMSFSDVFYAQNR